MLGWLVTSDPCHGPLTDLVFYQVANRTYTQLPKMMGSVDASSRVSVTEGKADCLG